MTTEARFMGGGVYRSFSGTIALNQRLARWWSLSAAAAANADLPDATSLPTGGPYFYILSLGAGTISLRNADGDTITTLTVNQFVEVHLEAAGTQGGTWRFVKKAAMGGSTGPIALRKLYVVGGSAGVGTPLDIYTPPTTTWSAGTACTNQKTEAASFHLGGRSSFVGYYPLTGGISNKNDELDEAGAAWVARTDCTFNAGRTCGASINGIGKLFGGDGVTTVLAWIRPSNWVTTSSLPIKRSRMTAAAIPGLFRVILLAGDPVPSPNLAHQGINDTYWTIANMPTAYRHSMSCFAIDHLVYACGGRSEGPPITRYQNVDEYNPLTDAWTSRTALIVGARYTGAGIGANARGYYCGGLDNADASVNTASTYHQDTWAALNLMAGSPSHVANTGVGM